jgi:ATP-dependent helicase/nuclease subunit A
VEAGAGSGKTSLLVERIVALIRDGVPIRQVAAVTFTEKAASELRDRLRETLTDQGLEDALDELDRAAIGTLHSFARRILAEHPIEAGLPPLIEVHDEIASRVSADRRFDELQTQLLEDPATAPLLRLAFGAGIELAHLRALALALDDNWDLVAQRLAHLPTPAVPHINAAGLLAAAAALVARLDECRDPGDGLAEQLRRVLAWHSACEDADDTQLTAELSNVPGPGTKGKAVAWVGGAPTVKDIKNQIKHLQSDAAGERARIVDAVLRCLLARIAQDTLRAAADRAAAGLLRYHDLLVLARRLVRDDPDARAALSERYQRLLLDESQDTDRLQMELAVRIAGGRDADAERWEDVAVPPGALFVVGDPKQSIYRFRRADIATYLYAQAHLGQTVRLTTNFRSTRAVLDWVNTVLTRLIQPDGRAQPDYVALHPRPDAEAGAPVLVLGAEPAPEEDRGRDGAGRRGP